LERDLRKLDTVLSTGEIFLKRFARLIKTLPVMEKESLTGRIEIF
jgi:hypothetical protein